jgi:hypothetical protein
MYVGGDAPVASEFDAMRLEIMMLPDCDRRVDALANLERLRARAFASSG